MGRSSTIGSLAVILLGPSSAFDVLSPRFRASTHVTINPQVGVSSLFRPRPRTREAIPSIPRATLEETPQGSIGLEQDTSLLTSPEDEESSWPYDWRKQWYSVAFEIDIPKSAKPYGVTIFDEPLVLFRDDDGALQCVSDFCPHRASKLSEGMVNDGKIECLYHGWQFDGKTGACVHVPQLAEDASLPRAANLRVYPVAIREGFVYVWMGDDPWGEGAKDILPLPCTDDDLDENKPSFRYKYTRDLPYDWSYLAENLVDPAHILISHDATEGGGKREDACPIEFEIESNGQGAPSPRGFSAVVTRGFGKRTPTRARYRFLAPGIINMRSKSEDGSEEGQDDEAAGREKKKKPEFYVGASLHTIPLGRGRSRLLFNTYFMNAPFALAVIARIKPMFLRHLNSCKVLEQDVAIICAQEDHVARTGQSLSESFLPIKSSDGLVVELRKWLDNVGHGMPYFTGWKKSKLPVEELTNHETSRNPTHRSRQSRFYTHVLLSEDSRKGLRMVKRVKNRSLAASGVLAIAGLILSCLAGAAAPVSSIAAGPHALSRQGWIGIAAAIGSAVTLGLGAAAHRLEGCFYENYERHPMV